MKRTQVGAGGPRRQRHAIAASVLVVLLLPVATSGAAQEEPAPVLQQQVPAVPPPPVPTVEPPRFVTGRSVDLSDIGGTVLYWGDSAIISGDVANNAVVGAARVTLDPTGRVQGDLLAWAAAVVVDGEVMHDVYVFAADVLIGRNAHVHGNVVAFAGALRIEGRVDGQVSGGGGQTTVYGEIGSMDIEASTLVIAADAVVHGDVHYESNEEAEIDASARVGGQVTRSAKAPEDGEAEGGSGSSGFWNVFWRLWRYLTSLVVGMAALLLGGTGARAPARRLRESAASALGFGFVISVVVPVGCLLAVLLVVTLPLGLITLLLFILAIYVGGLVTAQSAGEWVLRRLTGREPSEYLALALGLLLLMPLAWIPYAGFLVRYFAAVLGLGAIYLALRDAGFPWTRREPHVIAALP